ncbi:hypothetical protein NV379_02295 [Paenibacillus sp. N1-5-1-14]|uniref:hypothetical protein n=1 Tax=Paenibacillus radicibacter TaxID=2972488 RepID=UPI00215930E9|nr:hypothetical protein [Paenibacillus radicibacter]MCR8641477.1 hypothetical protein [Paenibacillus radicibacter]
MEIEIGKFYAMDHENAKGEIETNVVHVLGIRDNFEIEVEKQFYLTETMFLINGKLDSIYKNDWLGCFFKREGTTEEIDLFLQSKESNPELKEWAELVVGSLIK